MPQTLLDPHKTSVTQGLEEASLVAGNRPYDYDYPEGLDLRPGTKLHNKIKDSVVQKAHAAQMVLKQRFPGWREIDRTLTAYIPLDQLEKKEKARDKRKPIQVVVPASYAALDTLLTYNVAAFLEEPYFRYEGAGPEDILGAIQMELLVSQQTRRAKAGLEMHTMWRDAYSYGIAPLHIGYETKMGYRTVERETTMFSRLLNMVISKGVESVRERVEIYAGGTLTALDPYMCLPDPNTPIHDVQNSEFFGWVEDTNMMSVLSTEADNDGYFNGKYVWHIWGPSQYNMRSQTSREDYKGTSDRRHDVAKPVDIIHMYMRIIPEEVGLGDGEYPEWWIFEVAGDNIVLRARPVNLDHGQLPITVAAPDYDGHSIAPISRMEIIWGMQKSVNWFYNSHMANVRKAINDMLVVDPMLVNIHDVTNPGPGKVIRMRRQAWGRGVKDAVMQLPVVDVTRGHIPDSQYIQDTIKYVSGAQDAISGVRRQGGERVSATEANATQMSALSRLEKAAKIISLQAHYDIAYQMAWNTRQLMEEATYAKIIGENMSILEAEFGDRIRQGRVSVSPKDLDIDFDVIPGDGTVPTAGNADLWVRLYQIIATNPALMQALDSVKIFKYGAKLAGAKNLDDFVKHGGNMQANVLPDEQVAGQMQQGNMVPAGTVQ